jgi:type I restriction enzyme S subunit
MAGEWPHTTITAVAQRITKGTTPTTVGGRFVQQGINFVKVESITSDGSLDTNKFAHIDNYTDALLSRSRLAPNDILFSIAGSIGRTALVCDDILPANVNQAVAIVRPNAQLIHARFLYYVLRDEIRLRHAATRTVQSVQANFSLAELGSVEIPLPAMREQQAIAHILGTLDDKIELNRRMSETLETMARALFESWFVDFDPVRAKAEGRGTGLSPAFASLFPAAFVDSDLGEIPAGWSVRPIGDMADVTGGSTPSTKEAQYWEDGIHAWATPKDLSGLGSPVLIGTERRVTDAGLAQIGSGLRPAGTILLSSRAPNG